MVALAGRLTAAADARRAVNRTWHGLLVERLALWPLVLLTSQYTVAVVMVGGARAVLPALIGVGFAVACALRAVQITHSLRRIKKGLRSG
jgi:hypothetical protein